jgi:tetratricopeptide (TPR) repeat protein
MERGEYALAAARFQDALALNPQMPVALVNLGEALYFRQAYGDAIEAYRWAVKLEPGWTDARRGLVRALMAVGHYEQAAAQLATILENDAANADAWLASGDVAMARGDELMARENWLKATTVDPTARQTIERARARLAGLERMAIVTGASRK